jgi:hypothetical protein
MKTDKTSHSLNTFSFLSEEVERTLRLRAWKDEIFREALIADPKGVIQRLFPQYFSNGKLAEQLTIKVIEEEPDTCHIVLPFLPDEFATPEIPEEEQLELLANMGGDRGTRRTDSSDKPKPQSSERTKPFDVVKDGSKRIQVEDIKKDFRAELVKSYLVDEKIKSQVKSLEGKSSDERSKIMLNILQEHFSHYLPGGKVPEGYPIKVLQDTADTHHIVLPSSHDDFGDRKIPNEPQLGEGGDSCCSCKGCCACNSKNGTK